MTSKEVVTKDMIRGHSILLHAIRLSDDPSVCPVPFLTKDDLLSFGQNILPRFQRGMDPQQVDSPSDAKKAKQKK